MTFVMEIKILIVHLTKNDQYNFCLQSFLHKQALSRERVPSSQKQSTPMTTLTAIS